MTKNEKVKSVLRCVVADFEGILLDHDISRADRTHPWAKTYREAKRLLRELGKSRAT